MIRFQNVSSIGMTPADIHHLILQDGNTELERNYINARTRAEQNEFTKAVEQQWLDSRMAGAAMNRCLAVIQQERDIEKDQREKTDHAGIVNDRAEREMSLAQNIEEEKRRIAKEVARRQYLRENDQELKTLGKKLQAAYVCRDVRQQITNNEFKKLQEKAEEKYNMKIMDQSIASDREAELKELKDEMGKKATYRKDLRLQMSITDRKKQQEVEQKRLDKQILEAMVSRQYEEDLNNVLKKKETTKKLYCEMIESLRDRDKWKQFKQQQAKQAEDRLKKEQAEAQSRSSNLKAERDRILQAKEATIRKVAERNLAEMKEKGDREQMLTQLQAQLQYEKDLKLDEAEQLKAQVMKRDNKMSLEQQIAIRATAKVREKENDLVYRDQVLAMVAVQDKKEFEKEQKKKEAAKKYAADLKLQLERSRVMKQQKKQRDEERVNNVWKFDANWREEVRQEREKVIEEHAPHVLGYLQAGVLRGPDMPHVRRGVQQHPHLAHLDVSVMGTGGK